METNFQPEDLGKFFVVHVPEEDAQYYISEEQLEIVALNGVTVQVIDIDDIGWTAKVEASDGQTVAVYRRNLRRPGEGIMQLYFPVEQTEVPERHMFIITPIDKLEEGGWVKIGLNTSGKYQQKTGLVFRLESHEIVVDVMGGLFPFQEHQPGSWTCAI